MSLASADGERRNKIFEFVEERVGLGLWVWDYATGHMEWSRGVFKVLDIDFSSVKPSIDALRKVIHPGDHSTLQEIGEVFNSQYSMDREFRIMLRDGRIRWVRSCGELTATDGSSQMVGYVQDITDRKEKEINLLLARKQSNALQRDSNVCFYTTSRDGSRVQATGWAEWVGLPEGKLQDSGWLASVCEADRDRVMRSCAESVRTGLPYHETYRIVATDGNLVEVTARASLVRNEIHDVDEWIGVLVLHDPKSMAAGTNQISGAQIRAARAILRWSLNDIAQHAGVSMSSIRRIEDFDGVTNARDETLGKLRRVLEDNGISFVLAHPTELMLGWKNSNAPVAE